MSDIQYVYPLIHNKVTSPHYVTPTLRRARLIDWLNANSSCRAVVVAADAGYGKTTLLWQWEREVDFPCYWYKLDRNDRDWSLHISYLIEAISQRHAGFGRRAHSMLQQLGGPGSSRPGVAAYLLAEMHERLKEPCTFIIDDWQYVASVTEVRGLWNQILRDAPPTCRFIFLSRAKPHLQFARFKTHGGYGEIRTDALRFTDREIDELFRDIYNDPLDPAELTELERRTEGWAASLQLIEVSLRERRTPDERRATIESIASHTDSDLFAFLAEEVLDQQDGLVQDFLQTTSILRQVSPELAERLAGLQDGSRMLASLEQKGLFTYRLDSDGEHYRYHGLFRDFLMKRLATERSLGEITGLHIHAASYYETHQEWPEAIHHYLRAGLQPQAARLIARFGEEVAEEGRQALIDEWLAMIPAKAVKSNARLSLLQGEVCGIRGEWEAGLEALLRSQAYFARKGDRRMEALAHLKLSTVYANRGDVPLAVDFATRGMQLVPADAVSTRLRLQGNLAITTTWMEANLADVATACRRIAVEAKAHGWEHYAAIALHNLGTVQRHMGQVSDSVRSLEHAGSFWAAGSASPFADNAELVASLLAANQPTRAEAISEAAVVRTAPWPRPNAEANYGRILVHAFHGRFAEAIDLAQRLLQRPEALGPTAEFISAQLIENAYLLSGGTEPALHDPMPSMPPFSDPRLAAVLAPARALIAHGRPGCEGECLIELDVLQQWEDRGASFVATVGMLKLGILALIHQGRDARAVAVGALRNARALTQVRHLRWWLRLYAPYAAELADVGALDSIIHFAAADPEGWRSHLIGALNVTTGHDREELLRLVSGIGDKEMADALRSVPGQDVAETRRRLVQLHAPKLYVRSFGSLGVYRGGWQGTALPMERKRIKSLMAILVAFDGSTLSRDVVLDTLWPDADMPAAVNSLNQTVFQLRRAIDPQYRDGDSPSYVISNVDLVQLNRDLVHTDLQEFRRLVRVRESAAGEEARAAARRIVDLIRGQFLAELRYEDWASRAQTSVHAEVREVLLDVASLQDSPADLGVRAASALIELDELDEAAHVAIAHSLASGGRTSAARGVLTQFAKRYELELDLPVPAAVLAAISALG